MENDVGARFERLMAVASKLARAETRTQAIRLAVVDGLEAIGAHAGTLALAEGNGGLRIRASVRDGVMQPPDECALGTGGPLYVAARESRAVSVRASDGSRVLAVPVRVKGPAVGALSAELSPGPSGPDPDLPADAAEGDPANDSPLRLLGALAEHLGAALDREARLEDLARELTVQREAIDRLPLIVWVTNQSLDPVYVNARGAELTALSAPGRHGWLEVIHPLDREVVEAADDQPGIDSWSGEYRLRGRDGKYRWFLGRWCAIRDPSGRVRARVGCAIDIDAQKRAEETQRFVAQSSEALALSLDDRTTLDVLANVCVPRIADWCIIDSSTRQGAVSRMAVVCAEGEDRDLIAPLASAPPPRGTVGPTGREVLAPDLTDDSELPLDLASVAKRIGARSAIVVYALGAAEGTVRIALFASRSGRVLSFEDFGLLEELARRVSHALERGRLYNEAKGTNEAKDFFLATVSHELRGPLAAISMWTHVLALDTCDSSTRMRAAQAIDASVRAQGRLIEDMLDLSRSIAGKLRLEVTSLVIADVVRLAYEAAVPAATAKGIVFSLDDKVQAIVVGEATRLLQVLGNIISNAIEFTPEGGKVDVVVSRMPSAVRIRVRDTGEGVSPDFMPQLFKPFRQEDASLTRRRQGLGLGLAVARQIVELHGGTIRAESPGQGKGATFSIDLPLTDGERVTARDTAR